MDTTPEATVATKAHTKPAFAPHDSNPFSTTITGIKKLVQYNTSTLVGVAIFSFLGAIVLFATFAALFIAGAAWIMRYDDSGLRLVLPVTNPFFVSLSDVNIYTTLVIGTILCVAIGTLLHIIGAKLAIISAEGQKISFGELLRHCVWRILPTLGLNILLTVACAVPFLLLVLMSQIVGPIAFVLGIVALISLVYVVIRLVFAWFSVLQLGPIAAIRNSWQLTKGHEFETIGVVGATAIVVILPISVVNTLASNIGGLVGAILMGIVAIASIALGTVMLAGMAERFVQLQYIRDGKVAATKVHPLNYATLIIYFVANMIIGSMAPRSAWQPDDVEHWMQRMQHGIDSPLEKNTPSQRYFDLQDNEEDYPVPSYHLN